MAIREISVAKGDPTLLCAELEGVYAVSSPGVLISSEGCLLGDSVIYPGITIDFPPDIALSPEGSHHETRAVLFLDGVYSNYFWHWIMEYLPRVLISEVALTECHYVIQRNAPRFVFESLELLGIKQESIFSRDSELWFCDRVLMVEVLTGTAGHGRNDITRYPGLIQLLRARMLANIPSGECRMPGSIYISRKNADRGRRVLNEFEVSDLLREFGVVTVCLEELSLAEQLRIISSSRLLIGAHGAGMVHALFMDPESTVIELFAPSFIQRTNEAVLKLLRHQYHQVIGLDIPEQSGVNPNLADILVDIPALRKLMEELYR